MLSVNLICIGKLKEDYLRSACGEYQKRLGAFCKLTLLELPEYKLPAVPSDAQIAKAIEMEGETILAHCRSRQNSVLAALCIEGKQADSLQFADRLKRIALDGKSEISFVIGGSYGLSEQVKRSAEWKLSMSPMTFPHQLARVMLLEQIYRAFQIHANGKYHK